MLWNELRSKFSNIVERAGGGGGAGADGDGDVLRMTFAFLLLLFRPTLTPLVFDADGTPTLRYACEEAHVDCDCSSDNTIAKNNKGNVIAAIANGTTLKFSLMAWRCDVATGKSRSRHSPRQKNVSSSNVNPKFVQRTTTRRSKMQK